MPFPSFLRHRGFISALMVILLGISAWINRPRPGAVDFPRLDPQTLTSLTASVADRHRLIAHLTSLLYRGHTLAPWTALPEAARPLWSTICLEIALEYSTDIFHTPARDGAPTIAEAAAGYELLGATELAAWVRGSIPQLSASSSPPPAKQHDEFVRRYAVLLPQARAARLAYIREHADAIAKP